MVLKVTSIGNQILYIIGNKFLQTVTLTLFEGNLTFDTRRFLKGVMHVQLDNTKQNLSARNDQV